MQDGDGGPAAPWSTLIWGRATPCCPTLLLVDPGFRGSWHNVFLFYLNREVLTDGHSVPIFRGDLRTFKPPPFPRLLLSNFKAAGPPAELIICLRDDKEISLLQHLIQDKPNRGTVWGKGKGTGDHLPAAAAPPPPQGRGLVTWDTCAPQVDRAAGHHRTPSLQDGRFTARGAPPTGPKWLVSHWLRVAG